MKTSTFFILLVGLVCVYSVVTTEAMHLDHLNGFRLHDGRRLYRSFSPSCSPMRGVNSVERELRYILRPGCSVFPEVCAMMDDFHNWHNPNIPI